jgi:hypothetical protein
MLNKYVLSLTVEVVGWQYHTGAGAVSGQSEEGWVGDEGGGGNSGRCQVHSGRPRDGDFSIPKASNPQLPSLVKLMERPRARCPKST